MFKTEDIHDVFTKQIGVKINNETARQQTPAPEPTPEDHAHMLSNRLLVILFHGDIDEPDNSQRQKPATAETQTTIEITSTNTQTTTPCLIRRIEPR